MGKLGKQKAISEETVFIMLLRRLHSCSSHAQLEVIFTFILHLLQKFFSPLGIHSHFLFFYLTLSFRLVVPNLSGLVGGEGSWPPQVEGWCEGVCTGLLLVQVKLRAVCWPAACAAWFETSHGPVVSCGPRVGNPCFWLFLFSNNPLIFPSLYLLILPSSYNFNHSIPFNVPKSYDESDLPLKLL